MASYRFGKHPPMIDYRTLHFKSYLTPMLAPPPPSNDVLTRVYHNLGGSDPTKLFELAASQLAEQASGPLAHVDAFA
jgi:hypothetical protein